MSGLLTGVTEADPNVLQSEPGSAVPFVPQPRTVGETGLSIDLLLELALKTLYFSGRIRPTDLSRSLALPFPVVEEILSILKTEKYCEVVGSNGNGEQSYLYNVTSKGSEKVNEVMGRSQYRGPAPVTLEAYWDVVKRQSILDVAVTKEDVEEALKGLVLEPELFQRLGPAVNSGKSIFLFGDPGNGKTVIARAIGRMLKGDVLIPYAVAVEGQIIKVYDPSVHQEAPEESHNEKREGLSSPLLKGFERRRDQRWMRASRPAIVAGGELTLDRLELTYDQIARIHQAPLQMKANGGLLIIDDFGRQQIRPRDLLNRWIVPLDKRVDYLTLRTGETFEIPFDLLLVFSTNLDPLELVDEAFLRRVNHKINIPDPTIPQFREIFRSACLEQEVPFNEDTFDYLTEDHYKKKGQQWRSCHPRDLIGHIVDIARYEGIAPAMTRELVDRAWKAYFSLTRPPAPSNGNAMSFA